MDYIHNRGAGSEEALRDGGQGGAGDLHQPQVRPARQSQAAAQSHFLEFSTVR